MAFNQSREFWGKAQLGQIQMILKDSIKINKYPNIINPSSFHPSCYLGQCGLLYSNYPLNPSNPGWSFSALIVLLGLNVVIVQMQPISKGPALLWGLTCKEHTLKPLVDFVPDCHSSHSSYAQVLLGGGRANEGSEKASEAVPHIRQGCCIEFSEGFYIKGGKH